MALSEGEVQERSNADTSKEGRMSRKADEDSTGYPSAPLKNGAGEMDLGMARFWEEKLRELLEQHPKHFHKLRALAEGQNPEIDTRTLSRLRRWGYLTQDLSPLPGVLQVLKASVRDSADGVCVVDPLELKTPEDVITARVATARLDHSQEAGLRRLGRKLFDDDGTRGR
jgi:hypothetical protein